MWGKIKKVLGKLTDLSKVIDLGKLGEVLQKGREWKLWSKKPGPQDGRGPGG